MTVPLADPLKIASITAGGAGMFCGSCMQDNTLAATLLSQGVEFTLLPTFTPTRTDEANVSTNTVFLGGINIYLEQRWRWYRNAPRWLRRSFDRPWLLRALSKLALETRSNDDGKLAISLLRGEAGHHQAEMQDLVSFIATELQPDVVSLTNLLIAGFVPALRERSDARITVTLQGDDIFLDSLTEPDRQLALVEMRRIAALVDGFITFSDDYRTRMAELFDIPIDRITVVPLGLGAPEVFKRPVKAPTSSPPTLGYLARICPEKGFDRLIDAFLLLRRMPGTEELRLRFGGWLGASDRPFYESQMLRLRDAVGSEAFDHVELPDRATKVHFLHSIDIFSVPTRYQEPKGLYILEALAAGVPVVQPDHGSFTETLNRTGGGVLVPPGDASALASAINALLLDPERRQQMAREAERGVIDHHTSERMAQATLANWHRLIEQQSSSSALAVDGLST